MKATRASHARSPTGMHSYSFFMVTPLQSLYTLLRPHACFRRLNEKFPIHCIARRSRAVRQRSAREPICPLPGRGSGREGAGREAFRNNGPVGAKRATTNGDGMEHPQRGSTDRATGLRSWSRSAHTLRARISGWAARRPFANGWSTSLESHASTAGQSRNGANDRRDRICCEGPTRRPHEVYVVGTARHGAHRSRTG